MTMSGEDAGTSGVRRFEVFTGAGQRREWSPEVKAAIVAESCSGLESISAVARRHGLAASQLFGWRRQLRKQLEEQGLALPMAQAPLFVPAVIEPASSSAPTPERKRSCRRRGSPGSAIELEIDGIAVKIARGADTGLITAVIDALKASR